MLVEVMGEVLTQLDLKNTQLAPTLIANGADSTNVALYKSAVAKGMSIPSAVNPLLKRIVSMVGERHSGEMKDSEVDWDRW